MGDFLSFSGLCENSKKRTALERELQNQGIGGLGMAPKSRKNASKFALKFDAENHPKMDQKWRQNGAKMEPERHPKINVFLDRFADASGNIDLFAAGLRGSHFLQPTPQGGAILSKNIVQ